MIPNVNTIIRHETVKVTVVNCRRCCGAEKCRSCGGVHLSLVFKKFDLPPSKDTNELEIGATHWATCPCTGDPVLANVLETPSVCPAKDFKGLGS